MITKVYLAGASAEIERARRNVQRLRDADVYVVSTWVDVIGKVGQANPRNATPEQLTTWTLRDLEEVREADYLWLQLPAEGVHTVGAYVELGAAYILDKFVLTSGIHRPIFTPVLSRAHFETDDEAFAFLKRRHDNRVSQIVTHHINGQNWSPT